jgi:hypothetical protein
MWHAWKREETRAGFWWESPKEKDYLKDQGVDGRMGSKLTLGRLAGGVECRLVGSYECGDESLGSGATELVITIKTWQHAIDN